jgi:predicted metal-dependent peptidase
MRASLDEIVKINKPGQGGGSGSSQPSQQKSDTLGDTESGEGQDGEGQSQDGDQASDQSSQGQKGQGSKSKSGEGPMVKSGDFSDDDIETVTVVRGPMTGEVITKAQGRQIAGEEGATDAEGSRDMSEQDWKDLGRKLAQTHLNPRTKSAGAGKGAIYQRIMELSEPKVNWRQELRRFIGRLASSSSFKLPNRRHVSAGQYRYGLEDTDNALDNAVVAMDVSGSIAAAFPELAAEVVGIVKAKKIKTVSVLPFANTVVDPFQVKGFKKPTPDDFAKVRTGGGTEAIPDVISWVDKNLKGNVDFVVIMTDGYLTNSLPPAPKNWGKKTLWLVFDNPGFDVPSEWGRIIHANGDKGYWS